MPKSASSSVGFIKMHGLGNDFVVLDNRKGEIEIDTRRAVWLGDRRIGIGCDQIVVLEQAADPSHAAFIRFFNADGGEAGACGNATRCVARLLMDELGYGKVTLETDGGLLHANSMTADEIEVDMGEPQLDWRQVPLAHAMNTLSVDIDLGQAGHYTATCCSMGNPHATTILENLQTFDVDRIGALIETHPLFPERVNAGFAQILGRNRMRLAVWERGAGRTLACGSGACAATVAAIRKGLCDRKVIVELPLGHLTIEWLDSGHVMMAGPVATSFRGSVDLDF